MLCFANCVTETNYIMAQSETSQLMHTMMDMFNKQLEQQKAFMEATLKSASEREERLEQLLSERHNTHGGEGVSKRPISNKDTPKLISSATLNDFSRWLQRWRDFAVCQHLNQQSNDAQLAALRSCLDDDLLRFVEQGVVQFEQSPDSTLSVDQYIDGLKSYIRSQQNTLVDRIKFFKRAQESGESFDEFFYLSERVVHRL